MVSAAARLARPVPRNRGGAAPAACAVSLRGLCLLPPHRRLPGGRGGKRAEGRADNRYFPSPFLPRACGLAAEFDTGQRWVKGGSPSPTCGCPSRRSHFVLAHRLPERSGVRRAGCGTGAASRPRALQPRRKAGRGFGWLWRRGGPGRWGCRSAPRASIALGATALQDGVVVGSVLSRSSFWASGPCEELEVPKHEQKLLCGAFVR